MINPPAPGALPRPREVLGLIGDLSPSLSSSFLLLLVRYGHIPPAALTVGIAHPPLGSAQGCRGHRAAPARPRGHRSRHPRLGDKPASSQDSRLGLQSTQPCRNPSLCRRH